MERLRPVYETGVLRLLLRGNSMLYVALLRSTFDPLTGELPREIVEERFSRSLTKRNGSRLRTRSSDGYLLSTCLDSSILRGTESKLSLIHI